MEDKKFLKNPLFLLILTATLSFILLLLLYKTIEMEENIEEKMFAISTSDILEITQNNAKSIQLLLQDSTHYSEAIKTNSTLQNKIEENLKILLTDNIKYAYLLYKDNKGVFRFLADASKNEEKSLINQKFDIDSTQWIEIYDKKVPLIIRHTLLRQLSASYLIPIMYHDNVELILAIDFSIKKVESINQIINMIKNGLFGVILLIFIFLIILSVQTIKYSAVKKTVFIDKLTNVYNKNYLQQFQHLINLNDYILVILDIDYFKKVNDTYGHDAGDKVLQELSYTILHTIRAKDDIIIRYGGEEFVILAKTRRDDHLSALNVIERIFKNIQKNKFFISEKNYIHLTVSIGINLEPQESRNFSEAFKLADLALYYAKDQGRDRIEIYKNTYNP